MIRSAKLGEYRDESRSHAIDQSGSCCHVVQAEGFGVAEGRWGTTDCCA